MSRYLIDHIAATPNIVLNTRAELVAFVGTSEHGLDRIRWRDLDQGVEQEEAIRNVFLFTGAEWNWTRRASS